MESISKLGEADLPKLNELVNSAYRGEEAKKGWTHEADLIEGEIRTDESSLHQLLNDPNAVFLKYEAHDKLLGSVYLQKKGTLLYLGMLSVDPASQGMGIGKKLLEAAEVFARENNCTAIGMTVISARKELIAWYGKWGYRDTGKREPFPDDERYGKPRQPIEFAVLEKALK